MLYTISYHLAIITPGVKQIKPYSSPGAGARKKLKSLLEKFFCATQSVAHCFTGDSSTFLFRKIRFEPKIFWREDFLEGRSSPFAISSSVEASFIHSRIGSSHGLPPLCDLARISSTDLFSDISPRFLAR